jgi:hypothetical protein
MTTDLPEIPEPATWVLFTDEQILKHGIGTDPRLRVSFSTRGGDHAYLLPVATATGDLEKMTTDLPEQLPDWRMCGDHAEATYPEIRAYGLACWNAAIEAAAQVCEEEHTNSPRERELNRIYAKDIRTLTKGTTT